MSGNDDVMRALGRIEGQLEGMQHAQERQGQEIQTISGRLRTVEQRAASRGGAAGLMGAIGVTLIVEGMRSWVSGGGS